MKLRSQSQSQPQSQMGDQTEVLDETPKATEAQSKSLTDDETFEIIKEYETHPCLCQKTHKNYKNNFKKNDAIAEIATLTDKTEDLIKLKLRSLRTVYFQNVQSAKKSKSGSSGGKQPRWKFFSALYFLGSEVAECGATDNLDSSSSVISSSLMMKMHCQRRKTKQRTYFYLRFQNNADELEASTSNTTIRMSSTNTTGKNVSTATSAPLTKKKKKTVDDDRHAVWSALKDSIRPQSANEEFGSYVGSTLAQIKDDNLVKRAKCQIQLVLTKALTEHAEKELATTSAPQSTLFDSTGSSEHHERAFVLFDEKGDMIHPDDFIVRDDGFSDSDLN